MKEQIITLTVILVFAITSLIVDLDNKVLDSLLKIVPVIVPTFVLFINKPSNYLKFIYFRKSNINCVLKTRISHCTMDKQEFGKIIKVFLNDRELVTSGNKVINKTMSNYNYDADLKINSSYMKLSYDLEKMQLYIEFEGELSYKNFLTRVDKLHEMLTKALNTIKYESQLYNLTIIYKGDEECSNPFIAGLFRSFDNKSVNIMYTGKMKTKINISNNKISFNNDSILNLKKDLRSQLSPFKFR